MPETLNFNGQMLPLAEGLTLAALLDQQGLRAEQVATAVNGHFVPRPQRSITPLRPGDTVLTFHAITGG